MKLPAANFNRRPSRRPKFFRRAFTLVEIMVAIIVFMLVVGAIYASWMALLRSRQVAQNAAAQAQSRRVALHTLEDALMGVQSFQASPQYYSFILENGEAPLLSFTARVPEYFPRNGKFVNPNTGRDFNLRRLTFALEAGAGGVNNLVLRQNPVLMDLDDDEQKYPLVLARNVRKFVVECWGTNAAGNRAEWLDEWTDTNSIPSLLRVSLAIGANASDSAAPAYAVAHVYSLPSQTMPAAVQNGTAGGGPPIQTRVGAPTIKR